MGQLDLCHSTVRPLNYEPACLPTITTAGKHLTELEDAITQGDISTINKVLAQQAITLHMVAMEFMQKADEAGKINSKKAYIDIALRAFGQSRKSMAMIRRGKV